jgi:hypothetical protein
MNHGIATIEQSRRGSPSTLSPLLLINPSSPTSRRRQALFDLLCRWVLTFRIAGLLYLLCFDNLGAYGVPSETGLFIPSGYISYCQSFRMGPGP